MITGGTQLIRGASLLLAICLTCSCGGGSSRYTLATGTPTAAVALSVSPSSVTLPVGAQQVFLATVLNTTNTSVTWQVNGVTGGSPNTGTVSTSGTYTAPATLPTSPTVTITAISAADTSKTATATVTLTAPLPTTSYFVSTSGLDSNPGSLTQPWKTLQYAAGHATAGSSVNVRAGIYNEIVRVTVSGSASAGYITFQSYPGEVAIVDGSAPTALSAGGTDCGLINIQNQSYIIVKGFELRNFSTASTSESPAGILVSGAGTHIQILGNHIHDITTTAPDSATKMASSAFGLAVKGTALTNPLSSIVIDGNELDHLKTGASESMTINGNVNGFSVTNNLVHDNNNIGIDCIGHEGVNGSPAGNTDPNDVARNGLVSGNTVFNISSYGNPAYGNAYAADGLYVDGGSQIILERNTVHDCDINVEVASEWPGNASSYITVRSNLIYNALACGLSIGGYDSKRGGTDHCDFVNNTLFNNDTKGQGGGEFQVQYYATNNRFENNIVYANASAQFLSVVAGSTGGVTIDYNLFFSSAGGTAPGTHSLAVDPKFHNASAQDFRLQPTSPAVSAGLNLGIPVEGSLDLAGNPRLVGTIDLGAYEQ